MTTTSPETLQRELQEAERSYKLAADHYVRLVMIIQTSNKKLRRVYFADSGGTIRCVTMGLGQLEKPCHFKEQVRSQLKYYARHITEMVPRFCVTPIWREEVVQAIATGDRLLKKSAVDFSFLDSQQIKE